MDLTRECRNYMIKNQDPFRGLREQVNDAQQRSSNFSYVQTNLRELEGVNKMVLPSMFEIAHQNYNEQQEDINEVAYNFKVENLDPNRNVNKWESERMNKERKKAAGRRKMV